MAGCKDYGDLSAEDLHDLLSDLETCICDALNLNAALFLSLDQDRLVNLNCRLLMQISLRLTQIRKELRGVKESMHRGVP